MEVVSSQGLGVRDEQVVRGQKFGSRFSLATRYLPLTTSMGVK